MAKNISSREEVEWENVLSKLLCTAYQERYRVLAQIGFRWQEIRGLNLVGSPFDMAQMVVKYLVDELTEPQRKNYLARAKSLSLPGWME